MEVLLRAAGVALQRSQWAANKARHYRMAF